MSIPKEYLQYWKPWQTDKVLLHVTKIEYWENIQRIGFIEPRDPSPQHWAGMKAIFLGDPDDKSGPSPEKLSKHVKDSGEKLIKLWIKTNNQLYKSSWPGREWHVMTLDPIPVSQIVKTEIVT